MWRSIGDHHITNPLGHDDSSSTSMRLECPENDRTHTDIMFMLWNSFQSAIAANRIGRLALGLEKESCTRNPEVGNCAPPSIEAEPSKRRSRHYPRQDGRIASMDFVGIALDRLGVSIAHDDARDIHTLRLRQFRRRVRARRV
jgi:hypothetical protein